jgi:chromate reductase, NAD(P)H dehydrogenase (quinone)
VAAVQLSQPILAISGSLRRDSVNTAALRAAAVAAARDGIGVRIDDSPRALPHFNPDLEAFPPRAVRRFRQACADAGGLLLAVPEYTFGIPGAFKNALDWLVGSGSLYAKPIALLNLAPSGRGAYVREALTDVLRAHQADVAHYHVPITQGDRDRTGEIGNARIAEELGTVVAPLAARAAARSADAQPSLRQPAHN